MDVFRVVEHSDKQFLEELKGLKSDLNIVDDFGPNPWHLTINTVFEEEIYKYNGKGKFVQPIAN